MEKERAKARILADKRLLERQRAEAEEVQRRTDAELREQEKRESERAKAELKRKAEASGCGIPARRRD